MRSLKKVSLYINFLFFVSINLFAVPRQSQDLILTGHWVYDSLRRLELETKNLTFSDRAPLSIQEFQSYFSEIDYEKLSAPGKKEYEKIQSYLEEKNWSLNAGIFSIGIEPASNLEFYLSSDMNKSKADAIPWLYDYTKRQPLIDFPVKLCVGDFLSLYMGVQLKQSRLASEKPSTFFNEPFALKKVDAVITHDNYLSAGYQWDNGVGINFRFGINSQTFGESMMPSVVWSEYLTDTPNINLRIYSPIFGYNFNITQFTRESYLYTHSLEMRFWKLLEVSLIEGVFAYNTFDLRFANPIAVFHGLGLFKIYGDSDVRVNSLLSVKVNFVPINNMRIYFLWTQNEHQMISEFNNGGTNTPEGFACQFGIEYNVPLSKGYLHFGTEGYYSSPFLYIKENPMMSFAKVYTESLIDHDTHYYQWMGNPLGPDSIAAQLSCGYEEPGVWALDLIYNFIAKGQLGGNKVLRNSGWNYYTNNVEAPSVWPYGGENMRTLKTPTGTPEFINSITIRGSLKPVKWLTVTVQPSYIFINNYDNINNNNRQGFQLALSTKIELTKITSKDLKTPDILNFKKKH